MTASVSARECARGGNGACFHMCASVHSPVNVVRFAADPDVQCARLARDGHLGEERKWERIERKGRKMFERKTSRSVTCSTLQPMHAEGLKAEIAKETERKNKSEK